MRRSTVLLSAAACAAALSVLAGCADGAPVAERELAAGEPPSFSGPYANEYREAWVDSGSEFVRRVLDDETITDQEWAEVGTRLADCLDGQGMTFLGFEPDGAYGVDPGGIDGDRANKLLGECELESGEAWISYLRRQAQTNPQNLDENTIVAECLVREGVVAPGYTADDFARDVPKLDFPYLDPIGGEARMWECYDDPLSLLAGR